MSTGLEQTNFISKRVIGTADLRERFLEYMLSRVSETNKEQYSSAFFHPLGVVFVGTGLSEFRITDSAPGNAAIASDGLGNFLEYWNSTYNNILFENTNAIVYHVGLKHCLLPVGIQINTDHGQPEYVSYQDQIGESENPNGITDNGDGTIDFRVDNIFEGGVDNTGRIVTVFKKIPAAGAINAVIAIENCTVFYSGGSNYITTVDDLGQGTISTDTDLFTVVCLGPTVKRYTDLSVTTGYCYIGFITGNGGGNPTAFDYTDQKVISHNWTDILIFGLDQDFWPKVDATYKLGRATHQWSEIHTVDFLMSGDFLPAVHNTQDIGSTGVRWADGWFEGKVECTDLAVNGKPPGSGVMTSLDPESDLFLDLGNATYRWNDVYGGLGNFRTLEVTEPDGAGLGVNSNFRPAVTDNWGLGNATYRWALVETLAADIQELTVSETAGEGVNSGLIPDVDVSHNLGHINYRWDFILANTINLADILLLTYDEPTAGVGSDLIPTSDAYDLGSSGTSWGELFLNRLSLGSTAGQGSLNLFPIIDDTYTLGSVTYRWDETHTRALYLASGAGAFPNGIDSDCQPGQTDTWDLGNTSFRWDTAVIRQADLRVLDLDGGSSGIGCITDFIPGALTLDLGDASFNWRNAYLYNLSVKVGATNGVSTDLEPVTNNGSGLGNASYYWSDLYVTTLFVSASGGVEGSLQPNSDDSYDLGVNPTLRWRNGYFSGIVDANQFALDDGALDGAITNFIPNTDATFNLGNTNYRWNDLFIDTITLGVENGEGFLSNVRPGADDTYNLGHASYRWSELFFRQLNLSDAGASTDGFTGVSFKPSTTGNINLGQTLYSWNNLQADVVNCDKLNPLATAGEGCSNLVPQAIANRDLGNATYYWDELYCDDMYYKSTAPTTFDDVDDLALVDLYVPTEKRISIEKKGIVRSVRLADKNSIPWPMLGPKDPTVGDHFIHAGDSVTFLLGAIKQLHGKLKKAVERVQSLEAAILPV